MEGVFTYLGSIFGGEHGHGIGMIISHLILVMIIAFFVAHRATKSLKAVPSGFQNIMEAFLQGVISMGTDVIGEKHARKYLPLVATIGIFVFIGNFIGIIPGFESPTANINVTLVLALVVFIYYNYEGIRENGVVNYFAHFMGPVKALAPLMFPIEILSHLSRIVSLSFRLFGNVKGDDLFLWVLLMLTPWLVPLPAYFLLTFFAVLQTFIFMILTYVYLAGAIAHDEEHATETA